MWGFPCKYKKLRGWWILKQAAFGGLVKNYKMIKSKHIEAIQLNGMWTTAWCEPILKQNKDLDKSFWLSLKRIEWLFLKLHRGLQPYYMFHKKLKGLDGQL